MNDLESVLETLEMLSDPDLVKNLRKSIKEANDGKLIPIEEVMEKNK